MLQDGAAEGNMHETAGGDALENRESRTLCYISQEHAEMAKHTFENIRTCQEGHKLQRSQEHAFEEVVATCHEEDLKMYEMACDDVSGKELNPEMVKRARQGEINYIRK